MLVSVEFQYDPSELREDIRNNPELLKMAKEFVDVPQPVKGWPEGFYLGAGWVQEG